MTVVSQATEQQRPATGRLITDPELRTVWPALYRQTPRVRRVGAERRAVIGRYGLGFTVRRLRTMDQNQGKSGLYSMVEPSDEIYYAEAKYVLSINMTSV